MSKQKILAKRFSFIANHSNPLIWIIPKIPWISSSSCGGYARPAGRWWASPCNWSESQRCERSLWFGSWCCPTIPSATWWACYPWIIHQKSLVSPKRPEVHHNIPTRQTLRITAILLYLRISHRQAKRKDNSFHFNGIPLSTTALYLLMYSL